MYAGKWIDGLMEKTCSAVTDGRARFTRQFNCSIPQWKCAELTPANCVMVRVRFVQIAKRKEDELSMPGSQQANLN